MTIRTRALIVTNVLAALVVFVTYRARVLREDGEGDEDGRPADWLPWAALVAFYLVLLNLALHL